MPLPGVVEEKSRPLGQFILAEEHVERQSAGRIDAEAPHFRPVGQDEGGAGVAPVQVCQEFIGEPETVPQVAGRQGIDAELLLDVEARHFDEGDFFITTERREGQWLATMAYLRPEIGQYEKQQA